MKDDWNHFSDATEDALKELQDSLGVDQTGRLELAQVVIGPTELRISTVNAKLGTPAGPGLVAVTGTSRTRQVTVKLDASQQAQVKVGDKASITLPGNLTTSGRVNRIGTVAVAAGGDAAGSGDDAASTIPIYLSLTRSKAAGTLDQAPVQVRITTAGVTNALIVPVTALLGQGDGGYAVEKVGAAGVRVLTPVTLGMFDDDQGLVQVTAGLQAGDHVVVPST